MIPVKVVGLLLCGLIFCYAKRSHPHKHRHKRNNTLTDEAKGKKAMVAQKPSLLATNGTKKQSLGMPFGNLDQQGLGGEPVGHIHDTSEGGGGVGGLGGDADGRQLRMGTNDADPLVTMSTGKQDHVMNGHIHDASEGVGGLGGDADGVPIGMGAGAEPLGMSRGKQTRVVNGMDDHGGGGIQGFNEEGEAVQGGRQDMTRPFSEEQEGNFDGGHGSKDMMGEQPNGFAPSPGGNNNPMNMMGPSNGGHSMGNFMGGGMGEGEENGMPNGGGGGRGTFMDPIEDDSSFRGPKRDPLGGEIKPFNDEFKNDDGPRGGPPQGMMSSHEDMPHEGMNRFSPMPEDDGDNIRSEPQFHHSKGHSLDDLPQGLGNQMASFDKVNVQGDNDLGKFIGPGGEKEVSGGPPVNFMDEQRGRRPNDISIEVKGKPVIELQKNNNAGGGGGGGGGAENSNGAVGGGGAAMSNTIGAEMEKELSALTESSSMLSKGSHSRDFLSTSPNFQNPSSTADINRALTGNPTDLNSVNIQGDNEVAEMVRKATHMNSKVQFGESDSGINGPSLLATGYSNPNRQYTRKGLRRSKGDHYKMANTKNTVTHRKRPRAKTIL